MSGFGVPLTGQEIDLDLATCNSKEGVSSISFGGTEKSKNAKSVQPSYQQAAT